MYRIVVNDTGPQSKRDWSLCKDFNSILPSPYLATRASIIV
jgi:hypothetical protein